MWHPEFSIAKIAGLIVVVCNKTGSFNSLTGIGMAGLNRSSCDACSFTGWRVVADGVLHPKVLADSLVNFFKAKGVRRNKLLFG